MTAFISWNIQSGRGVDGVYNLRRIARVLHDMGDAEVICLQEVARCAPDINDGIDQVAALTELLTDYQAFFGPAITRPCAKGGPRQAFGNLVLTRLPVLQAFYHPLPQPADLTVKNMPRQASEIVLQTPQGPLRVINTHLEYYSSLQREAQIERLRTLYSEASANQPLPSAADGQGIFAALPRPVSALLCGDFNVVALSDSHRRIIAPFAEAPALRDAWSLLHPDQPHAPTCGVFDHAQWPDGAHCRDFFFISDDLALRLRDIQVNLDTDASDHQPLRLVLNDF